jgi:hypothetical protein
MILINYISLSYSETRCGLILISIYMISLVSKHYTTASWQGDTIFELDIMVILTNCT